MRRYNLFLFMILFLFACKNQTHNQTEDDANELKQKADSPMKTDVDTIYLDKKGNKYSYLGKIPDSLRTSEQDHLIKLINSVTYKYMSVKDNHTFFELTKEQYVALGIPERYYDLLQQNIKDNNRFFDANGIKDVNKIIEEARKEYSIPPKKE